MTLDQIKQAVLGGKAVYVGNEAYEVRHNNGQWLIVCTINNDAIGLTWKDGVTLNGKPEDFFVKEGP